MNSTFCVDDSRENGEIGTLGPIHVAASVRRDALVQRSELTVTSHDATQTQSVVHVCANKLIHAKGWASIALRLASTCVMHRLLLVSR